MSIAILSARTGYGHNSVMSALEEELRSRGYNDILSYPSFHEDLLVSNKILSDFYNFLLTASTELCAKFVEFSALTGPDLEERIYTETYSKLLKLIETERLEAIISTTPLINKNIIRILRERNLSTKILFYIVITDPFKPIASGFDVIGASKYFCPTNIVKTILDRVGIKRELVEVTGFPVSPKFTNNYSDKQKELLCEKMGLCSHSNKLLLNSGALGSFHYLKFLQIAIETQHDFQIILICGRNKLLFKEANKYVTKKGISNVKILPFINNVWEILKITDLVISKPGANSFFECLYSKTPVIIDGISGFLYQEKGVADYLEIFKVGIILKECDKLGNLLEKFSDPNLLSEYRTNIEAMNLASGTDKIVKEVLEHL